MEPIGLYCIHTPSWKGDLKSMPPTIPPPPPPPHTHTTIPPPPPPTPPPTHTRTTTHSWLLSVIIIPLIPLMTDISLNDKTYIVIEFLLWLKEQPFMFNLMNLYYIQMMMRLDGPKKIIRLYHSGMRGSDDVVVSLNLISMWCGWRGQLLKRHERIHMHFQLVPLRTHLFL